jgi:hypothetical protein
MAGSCWDVYFRDFPCRDANGPQESVECAVFCDDGDVFLHDFSDVYFTLGDSEMPEFADTYVLAPERSAALVARFLDHFAPRREEAAVDYSVPQFADVPARHFGRAEELVEYLVGHPSEPHGVYWRNLGDGPPFVMAFFTSDGAVILGLSCVEPEAPAWLSRLRAFAGPGPHCTLFEQPPPDSAAEFRALAEAAA